MSRIQLALKVSDLATSLAYYTKLFATPPHKVREGYANFAIENPPLKLVLIEDPAAAEGQLDHLGIEVEDTDQVREASARLAGDGLATDDREDELCCHAVMDKVWVADPDGARWEVYTITDDQPTVTSDPAAARAAAAETSACCGGASIAPSREPVSLPMASAATASSGCACC